MEVEWIKLLGVCMMPLWMLLVLIPLPGVSELYTSEVLEVYGSQRDCYEALHEVDVKAVCVEVE